MTRIITGLFDTRGAAEDVVEHLVRHDNVDRSRISIHGTDAAGTVPEEEGLWATIKSLFVPDEDRHVYSEGIRRGGVVLSAELEEDQIRHAMDVFEDHGAVDLDAREAEWRSSGWQGYETFGETSAAVPGSVTGSGVAPMPVPASTSTSTAAFGASTGIGTTGLGTGSEHARVEGEEVIPVAEETLRVSKRDTENGRVRVRSYVVETPVSEQVSLRDERVDVQRRAVNRPVGAADTAFTERTIEAVEHQEEAVVSKEARIVEEVVVRKDTTERTETVHDTVRRQEVEVEDTRTGKPATSPRTPI
jgi:uncharacterized protein (TIGR02271 family)